MPIDLSRLLTHATRIVADELRDKGSPLAKHLNRCAVSGCESFTLGGVCSQCSRHACIKHVYLTAGVPPVLTCAECIALEFEVCRESRSKRSLR